MTKEKIMAEMIKKFGFEDHKVIWFITQVEDHPQATDQQIKELYDALMQLVTLAENLPKEWI